MASLLKEQLGLELSETKTLITPVTKTFAFLGHHVVVRDNRGFKRKACVTLIPKEKSHRLRERIKAPPSRARRPRTRPAPGTRARPAHPPPAAPKRPRRSRPDRVRAGTPSRRSRAACSSCRRAFG